MDNATFDHLHLACSDISASEAFYARHFGAVTLARYRWNGTDGVAMRIGATRVNLKSGLQAGASPYDHLGLALPVVNASYDQLAAEGVTVTREPRHWAPDEVSFAVPGFTLAATMGFAKGPDGELLELIGRPEDYTIGQ